MITEDYVSFEIAKVLKDKGFDEDCRAFYKEWDGEIILYPCTPSHLFEYCCNSMLEKFNDSEETNTAAPTLQMTTKWLREVHNLHCAVDYDFVLGWYCQITSLKETVEYDYEEMKHYHPDKDNGFSSPEEAYEVAIKYCLQNLI